MKIASVVLIRCTGLRQFVVAAMCGLPAVCAVQFPSPTLESSPRFESTANEVTQVFTVLDRQGKPVSGLERKDFILSDDGAQVDELRAFEQQSETPLHIAVAIDLSGSVQGRVKYEIDVTTQFLRRVISPVDVGWIVGFNFAPYVVSDWARARENLLEVTRRDPNAGTAVYDTVIFACKRLADATTGAHRRNVLVVISDGEDNTSHSSFGETLEAVLRSGVVVLVVYTGYSSPSAQFRSLAESTGGELFFANTKRGVLKGLARAEHAIRAQYFVAYRPAHFVRDGRFRSVRIRTVSGGFRVRCRRGYYADPSGSAK
ncbi:MAG TPA: VWA domain-containing protein [Terriglobales bacterium]|nr:VWA domain-containing protein [Terriglobales bacterium]